MSDFPENQVERRIEALERNLLALESVVQAILEVHDLLVQQRMALTTRRLAIVGADGKPGVLLQATDEGGQLVLVGADGTSLSLKP